MDRSIGIFLCGDVMTGRGIDQVLPHPGDPTLYESYVRDAREYVRWAEAAHGPIERPVDYAYIWGDALAELQRAEVDLSIINLETSITRSNSPWLDKPVLYRMHPQNIACLTAAGIDCCCLANNHLLDWGQAGLVETLQTLDEAGLRQAGAGHNRAEASSPAVIATSVGRVLVWACGSVSSGIPWEWAATEDRAGVHLLPDLSEDTARRIAAKVRRVKQPDDLAVVSIHWADNWGYDIPDEQVRFAHRLVEEGVDLVYGHSSHHVKGLEVYRGRLILYGCGDFLTDYEGLPGYEAFRGDLALMYLVRMNPVRGELVEVRLVPLQVRCFRLNRASPADAQWLCDLLNSLGEPFATTVRLHEEGTMTVQPT